jgi:hypothetical protein
MTLNTLANVLAALITLQLLLAFIWSLATRQHWRLSTILGLLVASALFLLCTMPVQAATLPNVPAAPDGQVCSLRTVCKPLHPKPRVKVISPQRLDLMCYQFVVTITLQPLEAIPLALDLPPDTVLPPEAPVPTPPASVTPAVYTIYDDGPPAVGAWGWPGDGPRPTEAHYGNPGRTPGYAAPEMDPQGALGVAALLAGMLAVMLGRRS